MAQDTYLGDNPFQSLGHRELLARLTYWSIHLTKQISNVVEAL